MSLFHREQVVGVFRGFSEGGLEFHADLVLPYRSEFQASPMHGLFLIVELEHEDEGVLGRITSVASEGRLVSAAGEDYAIRSVREDRPIPEDLRDQYLKYKVDIRILGVIRQDGDKIVFVASHRRLPHVGAKVAFLSDDLLREIAGHNLPDAIEVGFLAFGEFIYAGMDPRLDREPWMRVLEPVVTPRFDVRQLVSRRTLVFARAGFGKSNLNKLLFADLYQTDPTVRKRGNREVRVGTVIFDPDGEYFWPDDKGRPGLCDVPHLRDCLVVFTERSGPSPFYESFVAGRVRIDIRELPPAKILEVALSPDRQDQQNVRKLKSVHAQAWRTLVDAVYRDGNNADPGLFRDALRLEPGQDAELYAARANLTQVVRMLHDPSSQMLATLIRALGDGKLCVVDISQMRGSQGLALAGIVLSHIFEHNQREFTAANSKTIPTIAVIEEAQAVLGPGRGVSDNPFVSWVKEGRKYDLGAVMVTQQPGSIPSELLSQGDNFFVFHLLSAGDLSVLKKANAHFSDDLLSSLLNEPLPGHGLLWSSAAPEGAAKAYPIPIRVLSFEKAYPPLDPDFTRESIDNYAARLRQDVERAVAVAIQQTPPDALAQVEPDVEPSAALAEGVDTRAATGPDAMAGLRAKAIRTLQEDEEIMRAVRQEGVPWMRIQELLASALPDEVKGTLIPDPREWAYRQMPYVLDAVFGRDGWRREKRPSKSDPKKLVTYVVQVRPKGASGLSSQPESAS